MESKYLEDILQKCRERSMKQSKIIGKLVGALEAIVLFHNMSDEAKDRLKTLIDEVYKTFMEDLNG